MSCMAPREFAFLLAATVFWAMRNMRAFEQTIRILRSSAPSNRRLAREIGSPAETNSVPTDRALCEYWQRPRLASPPAMHTDCFQRQGAVTSSRFAWFAKLQGTPALASCLHWSAHKAAIRRHSTSVASFPEPVGGAEKGVPLCPDTESPCVRREQRFRPQTKHSLGRRKRRRPLTAGEGQSAFSDLTHLGAYRLRAAYRESDPIRTA